MCSRFRKYIIFSSYSYSAKKILKIFSLLLEIYIWEAKLNLDSFAKGMSQIIWIWTSLKYKISSFRNPAFGSSTTKERFTPIESHQVLKSNENLNYNQKYVRQSYMLFPLVLMVLQNLNGSDYFWIIGRYNYKGPIVFNLQIFNCCLKFHKMELANCMKKCKIIAIPPTKTSSLQPSFRTIILNSVPSITVRNVLQFCNCFDLSSFQKLPKKEIWWFKWTICHLYIKLINLNCNSSIFWGILWLISLSMSRWGQKNASNHLFISLSLISLKKNKKNSPMISPKSTFLWRQSNVK